MEETINNDLAERWHRMQFGVRRSIRYHRRRQAFFEKLERLSNMLSVIFGSAAIYGILDEGFKGLALAASALVTVLASINLVIGSANRAREHADFARRYVEIEQHMLGQESEERLLEVSGARLGIEAEEPPVLHVLNIMCHNELMRATGYKKDELAKIGFMQSLCAHFFDLRESAIH